MGVLRFFRYLLNNYPKFYDSLSNTATSNTSAKAVDMLMLDLNAIFHPACRKVFFPEFTSLLHRVHKIPYEQQEARAFKNVTDMIEQIIRLVPPRTVLYLAIDGVAGMCKQSQQRKRRYKGAQTRKADDFDTCHITAGTPFMGRLCNYIHQWILFQKENALKRVTVIYDDMYNPGEGEHKLIRYLAINAKPTTSYCIYSPDADLIMLCMCLPRGIGYILRENIYDDVFGDWILVNCTQLKQHVSQSLYFNHPEFQAHRAVKDYVLFLMLLGNDFLPNLYCLEIGNEGIPAIERCYKQAAQEKGYLVTEVHGVDQQVFVRLFELLASEEPTLILRKYYKRFAYPDHLLSECIEDVKVDNATHQHQLNFQALRNHYYQQKFGFSEESDQKIQELCIEYIRGLNFVMTYYTDGIPTFDWVYPYHYAPLMCDLYGVAKQMPLMRWNQLQEWEYKASLTLNQALLGVIPPSSRSVCPANVARILEKHIDDPLFTEVFEVDLQGKQQEYEGVCLLPNVSYTQLKRMCRDKLIPQDPLVL